MPYSVRIQDLAERLQGQGQLSVYEVCNVLSIGRGKYSRFALSIQEIDEALMNPAGECLQHVEGIISYRRGRTGNACCFWDTCEFLVSLAKVGHEIIEAPQKARVVQDVLAYA